MAALLLEGRVDPARMRSVLASASGVPRDWIVESPCHVALSATWARALARAGVRLSTLEPVELVAVYAAPALARASARAGGGCSRRGRRCGSGILRILDFWILDWGHAVGDCFQT